MLPPLVSSYTVPAVGGISDQNPCGLFQMALWHFLEMAIWTLD